MGSRAAGEGEREREAQILSRSEAPSGRKGREMGSMWDETFLNQSIWDLRRQLNLEPEFSGTQLTV